MIQSILPLAKQNTDDPALPRYKRPPKRFDGGAPPHQFTVVQDYYRAQYYEVFDILIGEISRCFDQSL